jgi:hypothetical protein
MSEFKPVTTVDELKLLNSDEIVDGYRDGIRGAPEPHNNRSRAYWHGWRNGMSDARRMPSDESMRLLAKDVVSKGIFEAIFATKN